MIVPIQNAKHLNGFVLEMQKEKENTKEPPLLYFMHIHGVFGQMGSNSLRSVSGLRASKGRTSMPSLNFYYHKNPCFILC